MAYADFEFYEGAYFGDVLTAETAPRWLERASDEIDALTFRRLDAGLPETEADAVRVKKAVCAVAEALFRVEQQRKAASAQADERGNVRPAVASVSSGKESISYAQRTDASVYAKAVADSKELAALLRSEAVRYLANVPDRYGVNLLYAGVG